jgi:hypothetical protein
VKITGSGWVRVAGFCPIVNDGIISAAGAD